MNKISLTVATTSAHDSDDNFSDTSDVTDYFKLDNESDSDANESDSNVYFKSDDEYNYKLYERITYKEMVRLAKSEEKTSTKPKVNNDDDVYFGKKHEAYFD